ncbi:hypothetical protein ACA910_022057 [Epithemia clementina (nom. ined.)]
MDPAICPFSGVDVMPFCALVNKILTFSKDRPLWLRWERLFMGLTSSPYNAVTHFYLAEELAQGADTTNSCQYDKVRLNIPGAITYDPTLPWVMKWNSHVKQIAGDVVTFVDDLRASGYSVESAWQVRRRIALRLQYLEIQDVLRKRRPPFQLPGALAGAVFKIEDANIFKTSTQEKWDNGKARLLKYTSGLSKSQNPLFDYKEMRSDVGYFVHQAMTYSCLMHFLKGFFLWMNAWRDGRGDDGWKLSRQGWVTYLTHKMKIDLGQGATQAIIDEIEVDAQKGVNDSPKPPAKVAPVASFRSDITAISAMMAHDAPPLISIRSREVFVAVFGFGDVSGKGFGSGIQLELGLSYRIGIWSSKESNKSSNWREFANCVETIQEEVARGNLNGKELLFFFTDNSTVEACCYKGSSTSKKLLDLII